MSSFAHNLKVFQVWQSGNSLHCLQLLLCNGCLQWKSCWARGCQVICPALLLTASWWLNNCGCSVLGTKYTHRQTDIFVAGSAHQSSSICFVRCTEQLTAIHVHIVCSVYFQCVYTLFNYAKCKISKSNLLLDKTRDKSLHACTNERRLTRGWSIRSCQLLT